MSELTESREFSRTAWLAFVAHLALAFVVVAPLAYGAAQYVAEKEATEVVTETTLRLQEAFSEYERDQQKSVAQIRSKQYQFETDIEAMKARLARIEATSDRIDGKLDRLIERGDD